MKKMKLVQTRIQNNRKLLSDIEIGNHILLGINVETYDLKEIKRRLNIDNIDFNSLIFPNPEIGTMSRRNAIGEYISLKDLDKITDYRTHYYEVKDWGGNPHSGITYVPYKRFPRKWIEPKEYKFKLVRQEDKNYLLIDEVFINNDSFQDDIKFAANLILEIFNEVNIYLLDDKLQIKIEEEKSYVPWEILPPGEDIWIKTGMMYHSKLSKSKKYLVQERLDLINSFHPDDVRYGTGGYHGYTVFSFHDKNLYIFESVLYGNATYVFEDDWETVSKLSKKDILGNGLEKDRIVHNNSWEDKIKALLS